MPRLDLGATRNLPSVQQDLHDLARLAGTVGTFSVRCRQRACEHIAAGVSIEQAAPHCKDPARSADPSTLRRWALRRLLSWCCWVKAGAIDACFFRAPTILAWDLGAVCRILPIEARSP